MKGILIALALILMTTLVPTTAYCIGIGLTDTFQDGTTDNWFAGGLGPPAQIPPTPPQNVATGGPAGAGDKFLKITADSPTPNTPGSRIVALNLMQWSGNYLASGVSAIEMDLKNLGNTALTIRLQFEDPLGGPPADEAVTTFGQFLPVGSDWTHVVFQITPSNLTTIFGSATAALGNTTALRIIDSPTPTEAVSIVGTLGVDNITARSVPEPNTILLTAIGLVALACGYRQRSASAL
jgi:hypothetical protein